MWDQLSPFLFNQSSMLGWDYQNWMLVIGLPMVIFLAYLSERGWVDNPRKNTAPPKLQPGNTNCCFEPSAPQCARA